MIPTTIDEPLPPFSDTSPVNCEVSQDFADYLAIATAAINRGFKVTPVHPLEKRGILYNWNRNPATTLSEIIQHAKDFPIHNVGIVGRWGIGNHCFLDIDAGGVIEQIERDSGQTMPPTYTVCSSPQKKPWKRHLYFHQTAYSVSRLRKEANRKDTAKWVTSENTGTQMHPTMYDLKGVGGGGLVVGAGSVRKGGEIYTIVNDTDVVDIPDWLVDWLVGDLATYRSECAKERHKQAYTAAAIPEEARMACQARGEAYAFDISESEIYLFLNWRASHFARLGTQGNILEQVLTHQVEKFCAGGKEFVASDAGKQKIREAAVNKRLRFGNASFFHKLGQKKRGTISQGLKMFKPLTRKDLMVSTMREFPERITAREGYRRLKEALAGATLVLDDRTKAGQKAAREARTDAGFRAEQTGQGWMWVRT
jgi:hypothetical protein